MEVETAKLDLLQTEYKSAVDAWIAAIRDEEALASVDHSVADLDKWEQSAFRQQEAAKEAQAAKQAYENALREKFFNF
jgi:hypothetical protein